MDVQERTADVPTEVWERGTPGQRLHLTLGIDTNGVLEQMAPDLSHMAGDELLPVLLPNVPHLPHALQALWPGEALLDGSDMLRPQRHPVPENLQVKAH